MSSVRAVLLSWSWPAPRPAGAAMPRQANPAAPHPPAGGVVIRLTGSDTMVNLDQAWAENYKERKPDVSVQIAGGGSGVGIAGLIDGILDVAASSRQMEPTRPNARTESAGSPPQEFTVGLDALAVFVHDSNPLEGDLHRGAGRDLRRRRHR